MKTKIIPFDLEMAKKIQAGKIKGKIKTKSNRNVRIICWDRMHTETPIVFLVQYDNWEGLYAGNSIGEYTIGYGDNVILDQLVLEVPDPDNEPQFKPFDKVLVRDDDEDFWRAGFFSNYLNDAHYPYYTDGGCYVQCIPFEGNQELVGTTKTPKDYGGK